MERIALVIGATGGVGGETARALVGKGWRVRALHRHPEKAAREGSSTVEWIAGDAMNPADVIAAAEDAQIIVHAANPPGYRNWKGLALPMLESSIAAAKKVGARIVFPGTVYNFGPGGLSRLTESTVQAPSTRKGRIRVAMEELLRESGVEVLIVRAGDFFGARAGNNWFSQGMVKPGAQLASVTYPGPRDVGHAWAYLPDLAETIAQLVDRSADLERFAVFHFRGHWFPRGAELPEAIRRVAGRPNAPIRSFPWFAMYLLAPFNETFREMIEMRPFWKTPLELVDDKLVAFLGSVPHTPLDIALRETLAGLRIT